jgi:hypothetical protein
VNVAKKQRTDWKQLGDLVTAILESIKEQRNSCEAEARRRGITLEQLTAAAILMAIRERVET